MAAETTNWRQWRVKTNLGTLASIAVAIAVLVWQGGQIKQQIESNSTAVSSMATAVEELSATVALTIELDQRTNQLFGEIEHLRETYSDQAWAITEITLNTERVNDLGIEIQDLEWRIEDLYMRASDGTVIDPWQVDDLMQRVSVLETYPDLFQTAVSDLEWRTNDLVRQVGELQGANWGTDYQWEIDDLSHRVNELEWQADTNSSNYAEGWRVDDLYTNTDQLYRENDEIRAHIDELWNYVSSLG